MHCIGGLPKIIVLNELNFLIVLLQNRCMLNLKIMYKLLSEVPCSNAVHSREYVGYFLFLMLSVLFVCLYNELPQQPVIMQDILAAV